MADAGVWFATLSTEADGHALALDMMETMHEIGQNDLCLDRADEVRDGRPQSEVLSYYLRIAQRHPAVEKGFLAVLTDVIGGAAEGRGGDDYIGPVARAEEEASHG